MSSLKTIIELFGRSTLEDTIDDWQSLISNQYCYFVGKQCYKTRKSEPDVAIGTCTIGTGRDGIPLIICPNRFLEHNQVFLDCFHLYPNPNRSESIGR